MKLEIGGGIFPRGEGFVSVDKLDCADVVHDLEQYPWPFEDESVAEVYSSHCFEHLTNMEKVLNEVCRITKIGASVEFRVPAAGSDLMYVWDHKHCYSVTAAANNEYFFPELWWHLPRRLKLLNYEYHPTFMLAEFRNEMPMFKDVPDQLVMKWFPRTCHEVRFFYKTIENEHYVDV
jgi:predicted SAM-dependent methyltransferase